MLQLCFVAVNLPSSNLFFEALLVCRPVAMVWSERYSGTTLSRLQIVPGGRPVLVAVAATAGGIIGRELLLALT